MKTISATVTQYQADDGTPFDSEAACKLYEDELKRTSYWIVYFNPDLTEGRGTQYSTAFSVVTPYGKSDAQMWMTDYCMQKHGRPVAFVQGASPCPNWTLSELDRKAYEAHKARTPDRYNQHTVGVLKLKGDDKLHYALTLVK
jgi:hypothetical protein